MSDDSRPSGLTRQPVPAGAPFAGAVPNFVLADWQLVRPLPPQEGDDQGAGRRFVLAGLRWLIHHAVVSQRSSVVVVPDVVLAQCVWGAKGRWPRNWRTRLADWLRCDGGPRPAADRQCTPACPLHGRPDVRHRHFRVRLSEGFLGCLHAFRVDDGGGIDGVYAYDFSRRPEREKRKKPGTHAGAGRAHPDDEGLDDEGLDDMGPYDEALLEEVRRYRKTGRLVSAYLPALVFGDSPHSGLRRGQAILLTVLARETTRDRRSGREDKAQIVVGGRAPDGRDTNRPARCPYLKPGQRYVAFNGNGGARRARRHGRGYRLIGKTGGGWMARAGRSAPRQAKARWTAVRGFLRDLEALSGPFRLVAAGWHSRKREWRSLSDMLGMTQTRAGRSWLRDCVLRVFAPADYLALWRQTFAERLGFAYIPGGGEEEEEEKKKKAAPGAACADGVIASAGELDRWMRRAGLTDARLAARLGVSRSWVSAQHSGRRPWSLAFQEDVERLRQEKS